MLGHTTLLKYLLSRDAIGRSTDCSISVCHKMASARGKSVFAKEKRR